MVSFDTQNNVKIWDFANKRKLVELPLADVIRRLDAMSRRQGLTIFNVAKKRNLLVLLLGCSEPASDESDDHRIVSSSSIF